MALAAIENAAMIREYVPQRQILPFMCSMISSARGLGILAQEADAAHDHAAGAVAALHGPGLEERLLERVELAVFLEALDGRDLASADPAEPGDARADRLAIDQNGTGAASAFAAAVLGTRQAEFVAQHAEQGLLGVAD